MNTGLAWHCIHGTFSCKPRSGYLVLLWSNSGIARIGLQLAAVWQFSQGMARGPCGLRVVTRWATEDGTPASCQVNSRSQQIILVTLNVVAPYPRSLSVKRGCTGWTYLKFLRLEMALQLYRWSVNDHVLGLVNYPFRAPLRRGQGPE
jgi:hypothetical protein